MRKKLLALLMCATMVLGSSAVAFASPSSKDVSKAKEVFTKNGAKITKEYDTNNNGYKTVTAKVNVGGVDGEYAFLYVGATGVKINSDGDALVYIGDYDIEDYNTKSSKEVSVTDATENPSVIASTAISAVANTDGCVPSNAAVAQVIKTTVGDSESYSLVITTFEDKGKAAESTIPASRILTNTVVYPTATTITVDDKGVVKSDVDYKTADGYSYKVNTSINKKNFIKADPRVKSSDSSEVYWYQLSAIDADNPNINTYANSVAMAIEEGTLTTSAAGVGIGVFQVYQDENEVPHTTTISKPANDLTITLDCDILSNTSLKKTATSLYTISSTYGTDAKLGAYRKVVALADNQNVDFSAAYQTFDISFNGLANTGTFGVLIFEQGENESFNDGVSDTDTTPTSGATSETAATSPKTGDVAPIAALAVVMMGACGAMVVASKKRA